MSYNIITMTTQKYTSKVNHANKNGTLKSVIPKEVGDHLQLQNNDTIKWIIYEDGTVQLEKLEL